MDEVSVALAPAVFGSGVRFFGEYAGTPVLLDDPVVVQGDRVTHLHYGCQRASKATKACLRRTMVRMTSGDLSDSDPKDSDAEGRDLTPAERLAWDAFASGRWADLRTGDAEADDPRRGATWGAERVVRAEVLRSLLLGARQAEPGSAPGIRLRGARVVGRLDLMGAVTGWPLVCEYCSFDTEIRLVEAVTKTVRITFSHLPGLNATRMRLDGIFNLWGTVIDGLLRLDQAKVTGQVCLSKADIGGTPAVTSHGTAAHAIAASGLTIDGGLEGTGLTAHGLVSIQVARIAGSVDLTGARIVSRRRRALDADSAEVGGRFDCRAMVAEGEVSLHNAHIGASLSFDGAKLSYPDGQALSAGGIVVNGGLHLSGEFTSAGEVRLIGAQLPATLTIARATMRNPGGVAINLDRASVGVCQAAGLTCEGRFSFAGAHFSSGLDLTGARLDAPEDRAMAGDGAIIDGVLGLRKLRATGELSLRSVQVGRGVLMIGAELANPGRIACRLSGAEIAGDVVCQQLSVTGELRLTGGRIGGRLNLDQVRIANEGGTALGARALQAGELSLRPAEPVAGLVDLGHARIEVFRDDPASWPARLSLDGLTYQALEPRLPARIRLRWLSRDPLGAQAQPYEHLAAHYVRIGQPEQARTVWYARERDEHKDASHLARLWGLIQDITLGYGYRPWRALAWLAVLLVVGSVTFAVQRPPPIPGGMAPHFNPVIYTLDLLLPLVDLGLKHAFNPSGFGQWLSYVLNAAGWVLVTTVAAAAARVLRRG